MDKENSDTLLKDILQMPQSVVSMRELLVLWGKTEVSNLYARVHYYVKRGYLYPLRRGLYAKNKNYDRMEVAARLLVPSYISLETVLVRAGVIFQYYDRIFSISYRTRLLICDDQYYDYKTVKNSILTNTLAIEVGNYYSIATPERAFLDTVYLRKSYYFDNLAALDWKKVHEILPIYENSRMEKSIKRYESYLTLKDLHNDVTQ